MRAATLAGALPLLPLAAASLESCFDDASVPYDKPDSEEWDLDVAPFNTRVPFLPVAIAVPQTTEHIEAAIKCAVEAGVKVTPKSGGHSYASLGLGGEDGHMVVQLDRMHEVKLEDGTAFIQAGARLGHVAVELYEQGGLAISHGTCPGVGIGGHVLHGGFGMSSFTHGLALDGVTALTVTLANGTTVRATPDSNEDLFWGLRGAGSSLGIVSEFEFDTFTPPEWLTHFEVKLLWDDVESIVEGWQELQTWGEEEMPQKMNLRFGVDGGGLHLDGQYYGNWEETEPVLMPLVERLGGGNFTANVTYDWMGSLEGYAFTDDLNLTWPYEEHEHFYSKSLTTHALPEAAISALAEYSLTTANEIVPPPSGNETADRTWWILIDIQTGANSRISEFPIDSSSYPHRDKLLIFQFYDRVFTGEYPEDGFELLDGFVETVTSNLEEGEWGMYINYADARVEEPEEVYFGDNVERLKGIKGAVDPEDLFFYPLGIKPASAE